MKIKILGSGGGEGYPAMFCGCENCIAARRAGGKSIRTLSQALINDDLLIDFHADTSMHALRYGLNLGDIPYILITHTHKDHFTPEAFSDRGACYAHNIKEKSISIIGSSDVKRVFDTVMSAYHMDSEIKESISFPELSAWQSTKIGRYKITALPARHARELTPFNYIINDGDKTLLYFLDTGYPENETLEFIAKNAGHLDAVIMDSTMGTSDASYYGHMNFSDNKRLKAALIDLGAADGKTSFTVTHITHNNAPTHEGLEEIFAHTDIKVAYDGAEEEL